MFVFSFYLFIYSFIYITVIYIYMYIYIYLLDTYSFFWGGGLFRVLDFRSSELGLLDLLWAWWLGVGLGVCLEVFTGGFN